MTAFPFQIVGFDLDGTLLDTSPDLAAAVNHVLATLDRQPLQPNEIVPMIGGGGRRMLGMSLDATGGVPGDDIEPFYATMIDYYAAHIAIESVIYPGVVETLDDLARRGVTLAVATNKQAGLTAKLLDAVGLADRFACVIGGDTLDAARAKPAPDMLIEMIARSGGGRASFVGDSIFDVRAAKAAGIPVVAVSFGFADRPPSDLGADALIDRYDELIPVLTRLGR